MLNLRPAEPRDDSALGDLLVESFITAYARKMPEVQTGEQRRRDLRDLSRKREGGVVLVAELEGELVGTVTLFPAGSPLSEAWLPRAADLRHLAVAPQFFGRGFSRALMDEAERIAWRWGVEVICLHVRRGVHGVARLYVARGYQRDPAGDLAYPHVFLEAYVLRRPSPP